MGTVNVTLMSVKPSKFFGTFTGSVKVACKVPYRWSKCSVNSVKASKYLVPLLIPYR